MIEFKAPSLIIVWLTFINRVFYRYLGLIFVSIIVLLLCNNSHLKASIDGRHKADAIEYLKTKALPEGANIDSVLSELKTLYHQHKKTEEERIIVKDILYIGFLYAAKPNYIQSLKWFNILHKGNYELMPNDSFDLLYHTRDVYLKIKAYDKALEAHFKLKPFYRRNNNAIDNIDYITVIAKIYLGLKNFNRAIESYKNCAKLSKELEYFHLRSMMFNDIGICYERQNMPDSAIFYFEKSAKLLKTKVLNNSTALYDSFSLALVEGNIAQVLFEQKEIYENVLPLLKKDLRLSKKIHDNENVIHTYNHMAQYYYQTGDVKKCLYTANKAIAISKKNDVLAHSVKSHDIKGNCFFGIEKYDSAAYCFKRSSIINDSLNLKNTNMQIAAMEVVYALQEKDEQLKEQIELKKATINELDKRLGQNQKTLLAVVFLSFSLVLLYYAYYKRRSRERQLQLVYNEIETKNAIIEQTLAEKDSLLKEIHHRVKNNLQVISSLFELQSLRTDNEAVKKAIKEGQNRVKSMALIHQKLYQTEEIKSLPFKSYMDDLVGTLIQSYGKSEKKVNYKLNCDAVSFELDLAIPIGLITNELVSNSLKYAFDNTPEPIIVLVLRKLSNHNYLFKLSDNGAGLAEDFDAEKLDSLGIKLIKTLTQQIEAEWSLTGTDGTVFIMKFKSQEP